MRIAYFSPFPPQQTGIALYSDQLVRELRKLMQVDCYDFGNESVDRTSITVADFARVGRISDLGNYESVIYQIGNNPHFHLDIFRTLRLFPGIVVLHDVILYYLFAGLGAEGLTKHLWLNYGRSRADDIRKIIANSPDQNILRYRAPEEYPLTASIFPHATRIVVHNRSARDHLLGLGCQRPIHVMPLLAYPSADTPAGRTDLEALRRKYSIRKDQIVISCLGFIGPTKRMAQVCRALEILKDRSKFHFLIVGEGDDVTAMIEEANLTEFTTRTLFVDDRAFSLHLQLTDIVVNLRYPSMGESSSTLTRAMALGKPCVVSTHGAFADLPPESVVKIDVGDNEVRDLVAALDWLVRDSVARAALGTAAQHYTEAVLSGPRVAAHFKRIIDLDIKERAQEALLADVRESRGADSAAVLLQKSIVRKLPIHLRDFLGSAIGRE
jgi:glycosyltransferase involved in cell wall biosynthesis